MLGKQPDAKNDRTTFHKHKLTPELVSFFKIFFTSLVALESDSKSHLCTSRRGKNLD